MGRFRIVGQRDVRADEIDTERVPTFAENLLLNTCEVWKQCSLEHKQRLQQVLFPQGVEFANGAYRTPQTSFLFSTLDAVSGTQEGFGSPDGNRTRIPALRGQYPNR
jgi:hypothetical protein